MKQLQQKVKMKEDLLREIQELQLRQYGPTSCEWTTAGLLDGLQNGTHRGKGAAADQLTRGRVGLGTACKEETTDYSDRKLWKKKLSLWFEENSVFTEIFFNNNNFEAQLSITDHA
jgi:hypothetical protein